MAVVAVVAQIDRVSALRDDAWRARSGTRPAETSFSTCRVRPSRGEMYIGHGRLCVCVCLSLAEFPYYCTDPDVTWGMVGGAL